MLKLLSALIVFGAWEIAGRIPVSYAFPTFLNSMAALARMTFDGSIFVAYAETLQPLVVGVLISAVVRHRAWPLDRAEHAASNGCSRPSSSSCRQRRWPR